MTETFSLSKEESKRLEVLIRLSNGLLTAEAAGELLGLCECIHGDMFMIRRLLAV